MAGLEVFKKKSCKTSARGLESTESQRIKREISEERILGNNGSSLRKGNCGSKREVSEERKV